jgi:pantetheine-phosphate adenylyltransferase
VTASHALFPGTFDPPTRGHVDLVHRAARLFERVTVAVAAHPTKSPLFTVDERLALLRESLADLDNVSVASISGLVVTACEQLECDVIVRGIRGGTDLQYEAEMASTNRTMSPRVDTLLMTPAPELAQISSTLVRQIAGMGGDVTPFVPDVVARAIAAR